MLVVCPSYVWRTARLLLLYSRDHGWFGQFRVDTEPSSCQHICVLGDQSLAAEFKSELEVVSLSFVLLLEVTRNQTNITKDSKLKSNSEQGALAAAYDLSWDCVSHFSFFQLPPTSKIPACTLFFRQISLVERNRILSTNLDHHHRSSGHHLNYEIKSHSIAACQTERPCRSKIGMHVTNLSEAHATEAKTNTMFFFFLN